MKKIINNKFALPVVAIAAVAIGFIGFQAFSSKQNSKTTDCHGNCVNIEVGGMYPNELAIKTGEFVQFNTADGKKHNLSLGDGQNEKHSQHDSLTHEHTSGYESGEFGPGEAWRAQFKKAGTYVMHDHNHPKNRILIVVYNPSK